jgi:O-antigen ligase
MDSASNHRTSVAVALGVFAFLAALLFYGNQINFLLLGVSVSLVMAGIAVAGLRVEITRGATFWLWITTLGICFAFAVSPSPDSSFAVVWVIGLIPLAAFFAMAIGPARRALWFVIGAIVLVLALISAVRLGLHGIRPQAPLTDANSYGALLYVVLLMLTGRMLDSKWGGEPSRSWYPGLFAVTLVVFVIGGTQSRASVVIVLAAALFWLVYALRHRLDLRPLAAVIGAGVLGAALNELVSARYSIDGGSEAIAGGISVRMTLIESALEMYRDHGVSGIGLFVFPLLYRQSRTAADDDSAGLFVHNDYVQLFVEGGPLLVLPVIAVAVWAGLVLWRSLFGVPRGVTSDRPGAALALAALLSHALINFVVYTPVLGLLFGFLVGSVLKLPVLTGHNPLRTLPGITLIPLFLIAVTGGAYLWLDITTSVKLQGQPGIPYVLQPEIGQRQQFDYARVAQQLNPARGLPYLAEAFILDRDRSLLNHDAEMTILSAYRRALEVDPWNTLAWWQFRDFILRTESVKERLHASEKPASITQNVLRLDPLFVPAIEGYVAELASDDSESTRQRRLEFLRAHVGPRLMWLARQNQPAALHYVDVLLQYPESMEDQVHWNQIRKQIIELQPLVPERWFVETPD